LHKKIIILLLDPIPNETRNGKKRCFYALKKEFFERKKRVGENKCVRTCFFLQATNVLNALKCALFTHKKNSFFWLLVCLGEYKMVKFFSNTTKQIKVTIKFLIKT